MRKEVIGNATLLPGLYRALELVDQSRAFYESSARPISAGNAWTTRMNIQNEIDRIERKIKRIK